MNYRSSAQLITRPALYSTESVVHLQPTDWRVNRRVKPFEGTWLEPRGVSLSPSLDAVARNLDVSHFPTRANIIAGSYYKAW
jgi:hypothetical protein